MTELSLILPCFDEADRLPATLATDLAHLPEDPGAVEVLVVDDGSTDATAEVAQAEQVCQVTADADQHGKLKGKRLTDAVDALNALGGTWQLAP